MFAYIITPYGEISTFIIMIAFGILFLFGMLHNELKKEVQEENYIFPKIVSSMIIAYLFAGIADSLFKINQNGGFVVSGITFYGGLIGGIVAMRMQLFFTDDKSKYTAKQWFDKITAPFIVFHSFGRIGCFFAGCCYGKTTKSFLGVCFPDNARAGIFHNGEACYPTQLFEVCLLIVILIVVYKSENKFANYMTVYATGRFIIEFFRGDERGGFFYIFSPAQVISIAIIVTVTVIKVVKNANTSGFTVCVNKIEK